MVTSLCMARRATCFGTAHAASQPVPLPSHNPHPLDDAANVRHVGGEAAARTRQGSCSAAPFTTTHVACPPAGVHGHAQAPTSQPRPSPSASPLIVARVGRYHAAVQRRIHAVGRHGRLYARGQAGDGESESGKRQEKRGAEPSNPDPGAGGARAQDTGAAPGATSSYGHGGYPLPVLTPAQALRTLPSS